MPNHIPWNDPVIAKIMQENGIHNRDRLVPELAKVDAISRSTVYRHFDRNWRGTATLPLLNALSQRFHVPHSILTGPGRPERASK